MKRTIGFIRKCMKPPTEWAVKRDDSRVVNFVATVTARGDDPLSDFSHAHPSPELAEDQAERYRLENLKDVAGEKEFDTEGRAKIHSEAALRAHHAFLNLRFVQTFISPNYPGVADGTIDYIEMLSRMRELMARVYETAPDCREKLAVFFLRNLHVCAFTDAELGITTVATFDIDTETARPIKQAPRRANQEEKKEIESKVKELLANGVIEPSCSPWAAPIVLVKKKDGT